MPSPLLPTRHMAAIAQFDADNEGDEQMFDTTTHHTRARPTDRYTLPALVLFLACTLIGSTWLILDRMDTVSSRVCPAADAVSLSVAPSLPLPPALSPSPPASAPAPSCTALPVDDDTLTCVGADSLSTAERACLNLRPVPTIHQLGIKHNTDKVTQHTYDAMYDHWLAPLRYEQTHTQQTKQHTTMQLHSDSSLPFVCCAVCQLQEAESSRDRSRLQHGIWAGPLVPHVAGVFSVR